MCTFIFLVLLLLWLLLTKRGLHLPLADLCHYHRMQIKNCPFARLCDVSRIDLSLTTLAIRYRVLAQRIDNRNRGILTMSRPVENCKSKFTHASSNSRIDPRSILETMNVNRMRSDGAKICIDRIAKKKKKKGKKKINLRKISDLDMKNKLEKEIVVIICCLLYEKYDRKLIFFTNKQSRT